MQTSEFSTHAYDDQPTLGQIKINQNVIARIVRLAAMQVKGVAGVGGGLVDGISELFLKPKSDHRGVKVSEDDHDTYAIEIRVAITYGADIGKTAYEVQMTVRKQIIAMTGKNVSHIDVVIDDVCLPIDAGKHDDRSDDLWPDPPATD